MIRSLLARRDEARRNGADAGFTLIELLIVIVILGILAAIVVFSVNGITDKGNKSACQATVSSIDTAFEAALAQATGTAPTTADPITSLNAFFHNGKAPTKAGDQDLTGKTIAQADALIATGGPCA